MDSRSPVGVVLIGQPTLRRQLQPGRVRRARPADHATLTLDGIDLAETVATSPITCRSPGAPTRCSATTRWRVIHHASRGLPRAINNLAVQSLVAAFAADKGIVDESLAARTAVAEVTGE